MNKAPEEVIKAILDTLGYATVYCRNYTLRNGAEVQQVNELMEAIHDLPSQIYHWQDDGVERIKLHLECFDHNKWQGSPNLSMYFSDSYDRAKKI